MSEYTITSVENVTALSGALAERTHFEMGGETYVASRVLNSEGKDETIIFPSIGGEIDLFSYLFGDFPKFYDVTGEDAIKQFATR